MSTSLSVFHSDWGWIGMAVSPEGLAGLTLPRESEQAVWDALRSDWPGGIQCGDELWPELRERLLRYLAGEQVSFEDIPLDLPAGPSFWKRTWESCARIPYGETRSYAELARETGSPRAFRAVGGAMAANPIPIVIPCHRVVGSKGALVGFGGGLDQKQRLLQMESSAIRQPSS